MLQSTTPAPPADVCPVTFTTMGAVSTSFGEITTETRVAAPIE
jgi:hypothetical protein